MGRNKDITIYLPGMFSKDSEGAGKEYEAILRRALQNTSAYKILDGREIRKMILKNGGQIVSKRRGINHKNVDNLYFRFLSILKEIDLVIGEYHSADVPILIEYGMICREILPTVIFVLESLEEWELPPVPFGMPDVEFYYSRDPSEMSRIIQAKIGEVQKNEN